MPTPMSSRERVLAAIRREPVDHVPCCGSFNPLTPVQRRGRAWNFPWPPEATQEQQVAYQVERLGLDALVRVGAAVTKAAPGVTPRVWLAGDVLHKAHTTPAGELHAAVRYNDLWPHGQDIPLYSDFNIGHFIEPWIADEQDLECLKQLQILREVDEVVADSREVFAHGRALAERYGLATIASVGMGLTGAMHLLGATQLCLLTIEQPELVEAYLAHEHRANLRGIEVLGALGADIIQRNGFYETADFYSPATLRRFLAQRLCAEADAARRAGMVTAYTVHTGVMPILDYLADLTLDSLFGLDIAFKGVDLNQVRETLSPTKALWTGPSSTYHLWNGPEPTRRAVREVFECFGKTGLILSQCVSSHSIMPWESTLAMIDEWKRLR
jgi:uroporphyrinogen-III decarboxylase